MGISHIGEMIQGVGTTRIMGRPVGSRVPIKVVILLQPSATLGANKIRANGQSPRVSSSVEYELIGNIAMTLGCDVLDVATL